MHPALVIILAAAAALPLGLWLRHDLNQLGYRTAEEKDLPHPGHRWWVVWASVLSLGGLAAAAVMGHSTLAYLALLPLAIVGPWLAAVDLDVLRLPNRALAPIAAATLIAIVGSSVGTAQPWETIIVPLTAALATGSVFAAVHFATKSGIGFGDVKLGVLIGLAVGPLGLGAVWISVLAGSIAALVWARATGKTGPIAYGPWLLGGCWIAAIANSTSPL